MNNKNNGGLKAFLFLVIAGLLISPFISSCGKTSVNVTSSNIQYQVVNLSPSLGPISLYIDYRIYNNKNFYYPSPSGYFYLTSIDTPFQIRSSPNQAAGTVVTTTGNIFSMNDALKPNLKYTLFITGLLSDSAIYRVFLTDTSSTPTVGRGKIRFLNASPRSPGFDIIANGTQAFSNQQYLKVSKYIEVTAGNYNFQIFQKGTTTDVIGTLQNVTIQDGRLYTLYCYGLANRTDSLAFGSGFITNK